MPGSTPVTPAKSDEAFSQSVAGQVLVSNGPDAPPVATDEIPTSKTFAAPITAPTAPPGTNSTVVATTAFVAAGLDVIADQVTELDADLAELDASAVHKSGDEAISGVKTFLDASSAAQASFSTLNLVCCGDSQVWGLTLDDRLTQAWPSLIAQALPAATVTNRGINTATSATILSDLVNNVTSPGTKSFVWMAGRNDINTGVPLATLQANTQSAVAFFASNRYLLVTVPYQDDAAQGGGLSTTALTIQYNDWLKSTYPDNVLDLNSLYAGNADPLSAADTADVAANLTPRSLRNDYVHANGSGHAIQAEATIKRLALLAPDPAPVLEPKSQANTLGFRGILAAVNRANVWQRAQTFFANSWLKAIFSAYGDGTGFAVGGIVGGVINRWLALAKFQGSSGAVVKAGTVAIDFLRSDSSSDCFAGTRTSDLRWTDGQWQFTSLIYCNGDGYGTVYGSGGGKGYAVQKVGGASGAHTRQANGTIWFRTTNNADATQGTMTTEVVWNNAGWQFNTDCFVQGEGKVIAVGAGSGTLGLMKKAGAGPKLVVGLGTDLIFAEASTAGLVGNIGSATFTEILKIAAATRLMTLPGGIAPGGPITIAQSADANIPNGGIAWSTDSPGSLKVRTPAGTLQTLAIVP